MCMTQTTKLTARQTKCIEFLGDIAWCNDQGQQPSKADLVGTVPNKTRAGQYQLIDTLIGLGLVENAATGGNAYALAITVAGRDELAAHGATR